MIHVSFLFLLVIFPFFVSYTSNRDRLPSPSVVHPRIFIDGNLELDAFPNKTGSGTLIDPYVIKDLTFDLSGALHSAIKILNTNHHLVMQNLTINGSMGYWSTQDGGIRLLDCENVNITQCIFTNNRFSTMVSRVKNCHIYNNTSSDNYSGIYTTDCDNGEVFIYNNTCFDNFEGIHADGGKFIEIYSNKVWNNDYGVYIQFGEYCKVYNNSISNCDKGIYLKYNGANRLYNNSISDGLIGIDHYESFVNKVANNSIINNDLGIKLNRSSYNSIITNDMVNLVDLEEYSSILNNQTGNFHSKISIHGDTELDSFPNKTGSGIESDPYIIENIVILSQRDGSPIEIHDTTKYLEIRNVIVSGAQYQTSDEGGIEIYECSNITIRNCHLVRNELGIRFLYSIDCYVIKCNGIANWQHGIHTTNSKRVYLFNNTICRGGSAYSSDGGDSKIEIQENFFYDNNNGLDLRDPHVFNITDNIISDNENYGIHLNWGNFNTIKNNTISGSNLGIYLENSDYNYVHMNHFANNLVDYEEENSFCNSEEIVVSPRIEIDGNIGLSSFATTGDGTIDDPYYLKNLYIDGIWEGSGISIQSTTSYVILDNITVTHAGGDWESAIKLTNCENAMIRNCHLFRNDIGVILHNSVDCIVTYNDLFENWGVGLALEQSQNIIIENNQITTSGCSIDLGDSHFNQILSNSISNTEFWLDQCGIHLASSSRNVISENFLEKTHTGIHLEDTSSYNEFTENEIINNRVYGISLTSTSNLNSFTQNYIANHVYGISSHDCTENLIKKNILQNNSYGIQLIDSDYNEILRNQMINNEVDFEEINCYGNTIKNFINWTKLILWISFGTIGLGSIMGYLIYPRLHKRNAPKRYLRIANLYFKEGNFRQALEYYDRYLATNPDDEEIINKRVVVMYTLGQFKEVMDSINEIKKIKPKFAFSPEIKEYLDKLQIRDYVKKAKEIIDENT